MDTSCAPQHSACVAVGGLYALMAGSGHFSVASLYII
jgi:hypothetical protein